VLVHEDLRNCGGEVPVEQRIVGIEGDRADARGIERRSRRQLDRRLLRLRFFLGGVAGCCGYCSLSQRAASFAW
jgi:hypothetical protein